MGFLNDFIHVGSGKETPDVFLEWSGITLLSAVAGRKIWTMHGSFEIDPRLYTCLVGTPGSGKSTAMNLAEKIFIKTFPEYLVSESIQSREDILQKMTSDQCEKCVKDVDGKYGPPGSFLVWRPFFCIVDEMENFVSVDEKKMVGTLVGMYGRDSFGTGFKGDPNKNQRINRPYLTLLACTVPEWMMSSLRMSLFVGGLGRRLIIVHAEKTKVVPFPHDPPDAKETMERIETHLKTVEQHYGCLEWTKEATAWWESWFLSANRKNKSDPILIQFHETQHIQLLKVAMLLALSDNATALLIQASHMQKALLLLKRLENDVVRLTSGIGRNELAGVGAQVLDFIARAGGEVPKPILIKVFTRHFRIPEFLEQMNMYQQAEQLFVMRTNEGRELYMLPDNYEYYKKTGKFLSLNGAGGLPASNPSSPVP